MPPITETVSSSSEQGMEESFASKMQHHNMMLYIVCAIGGILLLLIVLCIGCKVKELRERKKIEERRKARNLNKERPDTRGKKPRSPKIRPVDQTDNKTTDNNVTTKTRRRSMEMKTHKSNDKTNGSHEEPIEEING